MARPIRPSDLCQLRSVVDVELHPDGDQVVFSINWPDEATDENRSTLHLHDGDRVRQLTTGHRDTSPRFSPDGTHVAFLRSEPKGAPAPVVIDLDSGAEQPIDGFTDGVSALRWIDDRRLVVLTPRRPAGQFEADGEPTEADELARRPRVIRRLDYRFNAKGWTHDRPGQVAIIEITTGVVLSLLAPPTVTSCSAMAPAPDGSAVLVAATTDDDADLTGCNRVLLQPVGGGEPTVLTGDNSAWASVGWTLDGHPYAVGSTDMTAIRFDAIHLLDPDGGPPQPIGTDDVNCTAILGRAVAPTAVNDAIYCPGVRGGTITVDRHPLDGSATNTVVAFHGMIGDFAVRADGSRIVAAVTTPTRPAELWEITADDRQPLHQLNEELLAELDLAETEVVSIPSTEGASVEAFLVRPPASAPETGDRRPGLVYVHGGPMSSYGLSFFDEFQMAAAAGYVVIGGNPRGSDGYGVAWASAVRGRLGTIDWDDVQAITDHLAGLGDVDETRIGIGGGSYGGFMTAWAVGHTDRYRAALIERCVINWESFLGTSDIGPWFTKMLLDGSWEEGRERLRAQGPIEVAHRVTTPSLILHSEEDWRCPIEQAEQLFAAYRRNGVDVTFIRFPGENHELSRGGSPRHRVERLGFVHDFYAEHLDGARLPS